MPISGHSTSREWLCFFFSESALWVKAVQLEGGVVIRLLALCPTNLHGMNTFSPFCLANFPFTYQFQTKGPTYFLGPSSLILQTELGAVFIHAGPGYNSPLEDLSYQPLYSCLPFFPQIQFICNIVLVLGIHDHLFTRIPPTSLPPGTQ